MQQSCMVEVQRRVPLPDFDRKEGFAAAWAAVVTLGLTLGSPWSANLHPVRSVRCVGHSTFIAQTFQLR